MLALALSPQMTTRCAAERFLTAIWPWIVAFAPLISIRVSDFASITAEP
jgi:hypothetical protein